MTYALSPDIFNVYDLLDTGSTGNVVITKTRLRLPDKADYIVVAWQPTNGSLYYNGTATVVGTTSVPVSDIEAGLLSWHSGTANTTLLFDVGFYVYDADDVRISLLQVYYPPDIVLDITNNVVNGGNFKLPEDGEGYDTDAGDFDTGTTVVIGYSYDGGDFDTGDRVGVAPPPASTLSFYSDGDLDPEADNIISLLDEDLNPINTSDMPNVQFYDNTVVEADFTLDVNYTLQYELTYVTKYFEGFDYGSVIPDVGYDIDYGSVATSNPEGYDFNDIIDYEEPTPVSSVS